MPVERVLRSVGLVVTLTASLAACDDTAGAGGAGSTGQGTGPSTGQGTASTGTSMNPPPVTCPAPIALVDTSAPSSVVGDGTPGSCDEASLAAAVAKGGVVVFDCGAASTTIPLTKELVVDKDTILDGGNKVTLSGEDKTRILHLASAWDQTTPKLTVQRLGFVRGFTTDEPNTKDVDQGGAAIFRDGGSLDVIDCTFDDNHCASTGQDVSGGAITSQGVGLTVIVGSAFTNNSGSNGGAVGNLGPNFTVVNSSFDANAATGSDGNPGNGGNGGAIVFDGADTEMVICGSTFTHNSAGAQGGAVFRVAYTDEVTAIDRCTFDSNSADPAKGLAGALYLENTTIQMTATTVSNNAAHYGGGLWIGHAAIAQITNVTFAGNRADQGGGLWVAGEVSGELRNCTLSDNDVLPGGYAPTLFGGATQLALANCIVSGGGCKDGPIESAGPNIQFPEGGAPCTPDVTGVDPMLGALADNGGPTKTILPGAGSPALGAGMNCPPTDQRGNPRPATGCALGAVEPP